MDLAEAVRIARGRVKLEGRSDASLAKQVTGYARRVPVTSRAAGLKDGILLSPGEALHRLAVATRPRPHDDVGELNRLWGLARYHAFFDRSSGPLGVSAAGRQIVGTQRRHTSEDLGIGFGVLLAEHWLQASLPGAVNMVDPVDVDVALRAGLVIAGRKIPTKVDKKRYPDYLLVVNDTSSPSRFHIRALECKGSANLGTVVRQLARAAGQLDSLEVDGKTPTGLAVATVSPGGSLRASGRPRARATMSYRAVELPGHEQVYTVPTRLLIPGAGALTPRQIVRRRPDQVMADNRTRIFDLGDVLPEPLLATAIRISWTRLAGIAAHPAAARLWTPGSDDYEQVNNPPERPRVDTPYGTAVGTSISISIGGQTLTVSFGVEKTIDDALSLADPDAVLNAQAEFATNLPQGNQTAQATDESQAYSASPDGAIFSLVLG